MIGDATKRLDHLRIELVAQRLTVRSIIGHQLSNSDKPLTLALRDFHEAAEKMSPDVMPLSDIDLALNRKGYELARRRAKALMKNFGALVALSRRRRAA
jgi:hypothetical protein